MFKTPYGNAAAASLYIVVIAHVLFYGPRFINLNETVFVPIVMLSLLVLSAAIMGFLFGYEPVLLYLDGKKQEATNFVFKMIGTFAGITLAFFVIASLLTPHSQPVKSGSGNETSSIGASISS